MPLSMCLMPGRGALSSPASSPHRTDRARRPWHRLHLEWQVEVVITVGKPHSHLPSAFHSESLTSRPSPPHLLLEGPPPALLSQPEASPPLVQPPQHVVEGAGKWLPQVLTCVSPPIAGHGAPRSEQAPS